MYKYEAYIVNKEGRNYLSTWVDDLLPLELSKSFDIFYFLKFHSNDYLKRNIDNIYVMSVWDNKDELIKVFLDDKIKGKGIVEIKLVGEVSI